MWGRFNLRLLHGVFHRSWPRGISFFPVVPNKIDIDKVFPGCVFQLLDTWNFEGDARTNSIDWHWQNLSRMFSIEFPGVQLFMRGCKKGETRERLSPPSLAGLQEICPLSLLGISTSGGTWCVENIALWGCQHSYLQIHWSDALGLNPPCPTRITYLLTGTVWVSIWWSLYNTDGLVILTIIISF